MKVVIFTVNFEMGGLALGLQREGVDVVVAVVEDIQRLNSGRLIQFHEPEPKARRERRLTVLDGLVKKASADEALRGILKMRNRADLVVLFDMNTLFPYAEALADLGIRGNFPTEWDRMFEHDRALAKSFVRRYYPGIEEIPTVGLRSVDEAEEFLRRGTERVWVLKAAGDAPTVVPHSDDPEEAARELLTALEENRAIYKDFGEITLEQKIIDPVEITPERVYMDGKLVYETVGIETKTIGAYDIGPQVGCGTDLYFTTDFIPGLAEWVEEVAFPSVVDEMAERSPGIFIWDASLLVERPTGRVYFGEFCPNRFGYNAVYTEVELAGGSALAWLVSVLEGKSPIGSRRLAASVRLFQMNRDAQGYPAEEAIEARLWEGVWLISVKRDDRGRIVTATLGDRSVVAEDIGIVTGSGEDLEEAAGVVYERAAGVSYPGLYYRRDLGSIESDKGIARRLEYLVGLVKRSRGRAAGEKT